LVQRFWLVVLQHLLGIGLARSLGWLEPRPIVRFAGGAIALCGVYLALH
jgi:hypothetical protein